MVKSAPQVKLFSCLSSLIKSPLNVHWKSFVSAFLKVSIDHLFDNLECGKRHFGSKICANPDSKI